jgi:hypothetical protein
MRRVLSAFVFLAVLLAQATPAVCSAAVQAVDAHESASAGATHDAHAAHHADASAADAGPHAAAHLAGNGSVPTDHEQDCPDLTRCHWAAVTSNGATPPGVRATGDDQQHARNQPLVTAAAALLTPPPKHHS